MAKLYERKLHLENRRFYVAVFFMALLIFVCSCGFEKKLEQTVLEGNTMGTYYRISIVESVSEQQLVVIKQNIEQTLSALNQSLSTYLPTSKLSHFNELSSGKCADIDKHLEKIYLISEKIHQQSSQSFNPAVGSLVSLWGFGPGKVNTEQIEVETTGIEKTGLENLAGVPSAEAITNALVSADFDLIATSVSDDGLTQLCKSGDIQLDFSAVAKGYAVDVLVDMLVGWDLNNVLVDIGGELKGVGFNSKGNAWTIAVEQPQDIQALIENQETDAIDSVGSRQGISKILELRGVGVATSGNYRNFFVYGGLSYAHTINPRTGYPVRHELLSATVVHPEAASADAWATAMMAMGPEQAVEMAISNELAVYLISKQTFETFSNGGWVETDSGFWAWSSPQFETYLVSGH